MMSATSPSTTRSWRSWTSPRLQSAARASRHGVPWLLRFSSRSSLIRVTESPGGEGSFASAPRPLGIPPVDDGAEILLDTSLAVALIQPDHFTDAGVEQALGDRRRGLAGHAAFETFAVLTRLPPPNRLVAADAHEAIVRNFPFACQLGAPLAADLLRRLPGSGSRAGLSRTRWWGQWPLSTACRWRSAEASAPTAPSAWTCR